MTAVIWTHELAGPDGELLTGGVQTYVAELARLLGEGAYDPLVVAAGSPHRTGRLHGAPVETLPGREWRDGVAGRTARRLGLHLDDKVHIVANAHARPRRLGSRSVGIQHGIYWDRPAQRGGVLARLWPRGWNLWRSARGAAVMERFHRLVCVDLAFPTMAACIRSPLPWQRLVCIPNFAPVPAQAPEHTGAVRRIVFARRLVPHRGTRILAEAVKPILASGWQGEVHIVGRGGERAYLEAELGSFPGVRFYHLSHAERLQAFTEDSLVVIPSLSTEGTTLVCIEAWSRGALVLATPVGGLANLVIDGTNGLLSRPLAGELEGRMREVLDGSVDVRRLKEAGHQTFLGSFTHERWARRWHRLLGELASG